MKSIPSLRPRSMRSRMIVLWLMMVTALVIVGALMQRLSRQTTAAEIGRAEAVIARGCDAIGRDYRFYMTNWHGAPPELDAALRSGLTQVAWTALRGLPGVEGGIWQAGKGSLAYAFPTYEGSSAKTDLPQAELPRIETVNSAAAGEDWRAHSVRFDGRSQTLLLHACQLPGVISGLTGWTMTRVSTSASESERQLRFGLAGLLACVIAAAALLTKILVSWSRHVAHIEGALGAEDMADLPALPATGEHDLDRIVLALNQAGSRLSQARRQSEAMVRRVATADRLSAIGRMTGAFAHEIRNPISAMRLKAENALAAGDDSRRRAALEAIIVQIGRLDSLLEQLLTASHRQAPRRHEVALEPFMAQLIAEHADEAAARGISLTMRCAAGAASLDAEMTGRAIGNLLGNALQHVPRGGTVELAADFLDDSLEISVRDDGPGVPKELERALFEPFVTGRSNGTGLGLSIVREIVESHGGSVELQRAHTGAHFVIVLPLARNPACLPS